MDGMIEKADRVLDHMARTDTDGALTQLFQKAKGIIMISVVEGALVVSGSAGVGIMMTKEEKTDTWSPPCACGMASTSWGFSLGAVIKDVVIFALDERSVQAFTSKVGLKLGVGTSVTLGTMGTNAGANVNLSESGTSANMSGSMHVHHVGVGGTVSIAFCQGAYVSASISGAVVGPRDMENCSFYDDSTITAKDILFGDVEIPTEKFTTTLGDVYDKLDMITDGEHLRNKLPLEVLPTSFLSAVSIILKSVIDEVLKTVDSEEAKTSAIEEFMKQIEEQEHATESQLITNKSCRRETRSLSPSRRKSFHQMLTFS
ncbi:SH3 domain containing, Ysc84-like 1 (Saccharomyces cerevisiae) [Seminavis robusta]|uniref:SH3 domain containing, Ysc84-like 1 (Saccharomyces cerevisiae) n=1 Tax=Seminavis robusta TaxID=568900 RepID=A0A9N8DYJ0_9STRA|nr:SH3 domain containing, Ysc84-like 1 (Saccharomyces cerevisiae) [Seminavis robusta]|eukprot:Sro470_g149540.1 SH3 domain containing, Ysc84-like 1 (Saccharomyces cerevisiae) (316) ;mRNA; f:34691-35638